MTEKQAEDNLSQVDVFRAIADPTRRALLNLVAESEQPVNMLAQTFSMSRPAISQHLRILKQAGLVAERRVGREHLYSLRAEPLHEVSDWVQHYEQFWHNRLELLGEHLDTMP
jgi:DNA-binding transcriptional ArsR family regulator